MDVLFLVGNHLVEVYLVDDAQTLTTRTGTLWRVKREVVGCRVAIGDARRRTHQSFGEIFDLVAVLVENHNQALALFHGRLDTLLQTLALALHLHFVDDHFNIMVLVAVHLHALPDLHNLTIHAHGQVALTAHGLEEFAVVSLTTPYQRGQDEYLVSCIVALNHLQHALLRIFHHRFARHVAKRLARACKEQSQVVVYLRGGAHRRARVLVCGLLFDTDHRRQT